MVLPFKRPPIHHFSAHFPSVDKLYKNLNGEKPKKKFKPLIIKDSDLAQ